MDLTKDFVLQEFVPPEIYKRWGLRSIWFVDKRMVLACQWLRDYTGKPVTINDWLWNKDEISNYTLSGFRPPNCKIGAKLSQHKLKGAVDPKIEDMDGEEIRGIIRSNFHKLNIEFGITTIELGTSTWCHMDNRFTDLNKLFEVSFKK